MGVRQLPILPVCPPVVTEWVVIERAADHLAPMAIIRGDGVADHVRLGLADDPHAARVDDILQDTGTGEPQCLGERGAQGGEPAEEEYVPLLPALSERHDLPQHPGPLMPLGEEGQVGERIDLLLDLGLYIIIARTCVGNRCCIICITCITCITRAYP